MFRIILLQTELVPQIAKFVKRQRNRRHKTFYYCERKHKRSSKLGAPVANPKILARLHPKRRSFFLMQRGAKH